MTGEMSFPQMSQKTADGLLCENLRYLRDDFQPHYAAVLKHQKFPFRDDILREIE